jgi:hypothetical protein
MAMLAGGAVLRAPAKVPLHPTAATTTRPLNRLATIPSPRLSVSPWSAPSIPTRVGKERGGEARWNPSRRTRAGEEDDEQEKGDRPTLSVSAPLEGKRGRSRVGSSVEHMHVREEGVTCASGRMESGVRVG